MVDKWSLRGAVPNALLVDNGNQEIDSTAMWQIKILITRCKYGLRECYDKLLWRNCPKEVGIRVPEDVMGCEEVNATERKRERQNRWKEVVEGGLRWWKEMERGVEVNGEGKMWKACYCESGRKRAEAER